MNITKSYKKGNLVSLYQILTDPVIYAGSVKAEMYRPISTINAHTHRNMNLTCCRYKMDKSNSTKMQVAFRLSRSVSINIFFWEKMGARTFKYLQNQILYDTYSVCALDLTNGSWHIGWQYCTKHLWLPNGTNLAEKYISWTSNIATAFSYFVQEQINFSSVRILVSNSSACFWPIR
jgi:hypothetical protein